MIIALDAMGGDYAPAAMVEGAIKAKEDLGEDYAIVLVGDKQLIEKELKKLTDKTDLISIINAPQHIEMHESPARAIKNKKDSSIVIGVKLQRDKKADAFVSAGNTGAVLASSLLYLGRIPGVHRPTIGSYLPTEGKGCIILDVGANIVCKPINLVQFAIMGSIYASHIFDFKNPRVGLLNIGEESSKGNDLYVETFKLMQKLVPNFAGNIEGRDILRGKVDVVICDGFVGNVVLKFAEGIYSMIHRKIAENLQKKPFSKLGFYLFRSAIKPLRKSLDYQEYGGVPLLGVRGVSIICHGSSTSYAIKNAIKVAAKMVNEGINDLIKENIQKVKISRVV